MLLVEQKATAACVHLTMSISTQLIATPLASTISRAAETISRPIPSPACNSHNRSGRQSRDSCPVLLTLTVKDKHRVRAASPNGHAQRAAHCCHQHLPTGPRACQVRREGTSENDVPIKGQIIHSTHPQPWPRTAHRTCS